MNGAAGRSRRGRFCCILRWSCRWRLWCSRRSRSLGTSRERAASRSADLREGQSAVAPIPGELPPTGSRAGPGSARIGRWARKRSPQPARRTPSRVYQRADTIGTTNPVAFELHAVYYTGMIDAVPHVPERCVVAGGGEMCRSSDHAGPARPFAGCRRSRGARRRRDQVFRPFRCDVSAHPLPRGVEHLAMSISSFDQASSDQDIWAGYFFIANGGVVASASGVRGLAYRLDSDYAYYAKIQFSSVTVGSAEARISRGGCAARPFQSSRCMPNWDEVEAGTWISRIIRSSLDKSVATGKQEHGVQGQHEVRHHSRRLGRCGSRSASVRGGVLAA